MIAHPWKQGPPHDSIEQSSYRSKISRCPARPLAEWLYEAMADQICRRHKTTVRASGRLYLTIANLMQVNGCLWNPENLSDSQALQPIVVASECEVYEAMP